MESEVNLKFMVDARLREKLGKVLDRKKVTLTGGMSQLIEWFCELDDVAQSMVLGQIEATPDLLKMVLEKKGDRNDEPFVRTPGGGAILKRR